MKAPRQTAAHGIDTCGKVGFAKLYDRKTALTAADLLNDRMVPFFETHGIPLSRVLTDRGICERFNRTVLNEF